LRGEKIMAEVEVEKISALVPHLLSIPCKKIWADYDEELMYFTLTSRSLAMQTNQNLPMMTLL
jgi:hypothetical protein